MNERGRLYAAVAGTCLLFIAVQLGALSLVQPFTEAEMQAVEDPDDPTSSVVYVVAILVMTGLMLAAFKYDFAWIIRGLIIAVSVLLAWFVFAALVPPVVVAGYAGVLPLLGALAVGAALLVYPEWYVIDLAGVIMGAGAAGLFGISLGLLPVLLLLVVLAVYDAISVYRTKHMLDLAEGVMDLRIPVVLVVPTSLSYSFLATNNQPDSLEAGRDASRAGEPADLADESTTNASARDQERETKPASDGASGDEHGPDPDPDPDPDPETRDALFIGLGDAVIPTILVASAATFVDAGHLEVATIALNVPALGAMIGTLAGLLALLYFVTKGRPHAGLPLLNTGAIGGYLVGALWAGVPLVSALGL